MQEKILIGTGGLNWFTNERVTDRYGTVNMMLNNTNNEQIAENACLFDDIIKQYIGKKGKLICKVLQTRQSTHIGDIIHGLYPSTPNIGDEIELGEGFLFLEYSKKEDIWKVGLKPEDDRDTFWLNPKSLYKLHEQTVDLYFLLSEIV